MAISSLVLGGAAALLVGTVSAVTAVSDSLMNTMLNEGGVGLAMSASPGWFFGQAMKNPPCYPTFAVQNGQQTPGSSPCNWPNTGCNCRNPGVGIGNEGPSFPVYYTYQKCNDNEVRVAYNLYYEHDGFQPEGGNGHRHDWEHAIVSWGKGEDGQWTPSKLILSQHSGNKALNWGNIQNTFNTADFSQKLLGDNGRKNLDHPKVYVAWSKHANFDTRNTGSNDIVSQSLPQAFRSQDWWYYPRSNDYIRADLSTDVGNQINSFSWGNADTTPVVLHNKLCSV